MTCSVIPSGKTYQVSSALLKQMKHISAFAIVAGSSSKPNHCCIPLLLAFEILKELQADPLTIGMSKKGLWSLGCL